MVRNSVLKFFVLVKCVIFTIFLSLIFGFGFKNVNAQESNNIKTLEKGVLSVGTNATFKPFEYVEDGKVVGFDIALCEAIARKLGLTLKVYDMEFSSLIPSLGGKLDLVAAGMTQTPQRANAVSFSDIYFTSKQYILTLKDVNVVDLSSINGFSVGTQLGTTASECVKNLKGINHKEYNNYDVIVNDLINKRLNAAVFDEHTAKVYEHIHKDKIKVTDGSLLNFNVENYCFACPKQNIELLNAVNKALVEVKNDNGPGGYNDIVKEYITNFSSKITKKEEGILNDLKEAFFDKSRAKQYLKGLFLTLQVTFFAAILGLFFGVILAILKVKKSKKGKNSILNKLASVYVDVIRGTPVVVQLLIMWSIVMKSSKNGVFVAILAFGLNSAAYVAEIIRGGINSVDKGQMEAGLSMGFNSLQTMRYIVLPQGFKNSIPALCNEFISLLKETAIMGYVGLQDLTRVADSISATTYKHFMPLIIVAIMYFVVTKIISILLNVLERKLSR